MRAHELVSEVNYPDELSVSDQIQQYFFKRGYDLAGEGRDQMAFVSPRGTIVKVLGTGDAALKDGPCEGQINACFVGCDDKMRHAGTGFHE